MQLMMLMHAIKKSIAAGLLLLLFFSATAAKWVKLEPGYFVSKVHDARHWSAVAHLHRRQSSFPIIQLYLEDVPVLNQCQLGCTKAQKKAPDLPALKPARWISHMKL